MSAVLCWAKADVEALLRVDDKSQDKRDGMIRVRGLSNAGLVWERYLDLWDGTALVKDESKRAALVRFASDVSAKGKTVDPSRNHVKTLLRDLHARQARVAEVLSRRGAASTLTMTLASRFATGLGADHPNEIGFLFDRSLGVPYLPGSSLKGLCRAAAHFMGEEAGVMKKMFGPDEIREDGDGCVGDLVFLDGYPTTWPRLEVDIINCHHSGYYNRGGKAPSEAESPVPVYFLTVASGTPWTFRVVSRSGDYHERAERLLQTALTELGAGAKTAVGYGVFGRDQPPG